MNLVNKADNDMKTVSINIEETAKGMNILIDGTRFVVPNHWFWKEFADSWEPQTLKFFKKNLLPGTDYLDIGAWVGPTAFIATALGANKLKIVEPNPLNFLNLLVTQLNNKLFSKWFLINACVSNNRDPVIIGPIEGIMSASSATNIRNQKQEGAKILSLELPDLVSKDDDFSLVKIDIEGAEAFIIEGLDIFSSTRAAVWLSIHPPFIDDKKQFLEKLILLKNVFYIVDEDNCIIDDAKLEEWITTDLEFPSWGTKWGNFFEVGLLPMSCFRPDGIRKNEGTGIWQESA